MTQKKRLLGLFSIMLILALAVMVTACGAKAGGDPGEEEPQGGDAEPAVEVVKVIDEIDTEDMMDLPLQIESITLLEDGTVRIIPTEDLLKNAETNNEIVDGAIYPFNDSGKVKDIYLVRFGNGGYRTVICLMDDGTLSALSANELINDHITVVWDKLTGRDTYVSVREVQEEDLDAFGVIGVTADGEEIDLDFSLDF